MLHPIGKEWRDSHSRTQSIVISEFHKQKEHVPIVLLVVAEYSQVLFQGLISPFCLSVTFGMVSGGEVELHIQCFSEGSEESGDEFGAMVGGDMLGYSVFREHMSDE